MKNSLLILLFLLTVSLTLAQSTEKNTEWMKYLEELAESGTEENIPENLVEELSYLTENPFNLHTVTKKDLERLPFLSGIQIENLLYYIYKYSPLQSIYELKNVEALDMQTISLLLPFVYVGELQKQKNNISLNNLTKHIKQNFFLRSDYCLQEKAGYKYNSTEELDSFPNKYYLGENYYLSFKYGIQYNEKLQLGFVGEKDFGEPLWNKYNKGFDHISTNFVLKDIGLLQALYIGDYRLSFGQGLIINNDFTTGKTSDVLNINKKTGGIKRHFSTNEIDYLRGAAMTFELKKIKLNVFLSNRKFDATSDSTTIYTFKADGYNRTFKDLEKKDNAKVNLFGTNLQWENKSCILGITSIYYNFNGKELNPDLKLYNTFYLRGYSNYNIGINYSLRRKKIFFQGETALSQNGGIATTNLIQLNPSSSLGIVFAYRNYSKDYQSFYGRSFSESSSIQNETGFYIGINLRLLKYWEIKAYIDYFKFPWLKYGIDAPSKGEDELLQINFKPNQNLNVNMRYKYKEKYKNTNETKTPLNSTSPYQQHKFRSQISYSINKECNFEAQIDKNIYINIDKKKNIGWSISQSLNYTPKKFPIKIDLATVYFQTDSWDNRINVYEQNILYAFSFPTYYGKGLRYYSVLKINMSKNLTFYTKIASTYYLDRDKISSELEEINGNEKTDIYCLLRLVI